MMKSTARRLFAACLFVSAGAAMAAESGSEILDKAWAKAMVANRLDDVVLTYAEDAVLWLPGAGALHGRTAIRQAFAGLLAENTVLDVSLSDTSYTMQGDLSAGWGKFKLKMQPKAGGEPVVMEGRFTDVARRKGQQWFYVSDHTSAEPAAK